MTNQLPDLFPEAQWGGKVTALSLPPEGSPAAWSHLVPLRGWNCHPLAPYLPHGKLVCQVAWRGERPGQGYRLTVGWRDRVHARHDRPEHADVTRDLGVNLSKVLSDVPEGVKTTWTVDVRDWAATEAQPAVPFDFQEVFGLVFGGEDAGKTKLEITDLKVTSPDPEPSAPLVKLDQVGYGRDAKKQARIGFFPGTKNIGPDTAFWVKHEPEGTVVLSGRLKLLSSLDAVDSGETLLLADFTELRTPGVFRLVVEGHEAEASSRFTIAAQPYREAFFHSFRYFLHQRSGMDLTPPWVPDYPRPDQTPRDREARFDSDPSRTKDVRGGWFDAGDKGKYVGPGAIAVADLLWAYELYPGVLGDGAFHLPESGRGVPDLLSEVRWELEWMLRMQDEQTGHFWARVQSVHDTLADTERRIRDQDGDQAGVASTCDTAYAVAALAQAAALWTSLDPAFADRCRDSAERGWRWLEKTPRLISAPPGPYRVSDPAIDSQGRLWAAAALWRATGKTPYRAAFHQRYTQHRGCLTARDVYAHYWTGMASLAFLTYLAGPDPDPQVKADLEADLAVWGQTMLARWKANPWGVTTLEGNYVWGSVTSILNVPMTGQLGRRLLGNRFPGTAEEWTDLGLDALHWIFGGNPLSLSFVTGLGDRAVTRLFSNIYSHDRRDGLPAGYLAGGPNNNEGRTLSRFAAKCYLDSYGDWVSNEHTIYWNSPLVFLLAWAQNGVDQ